MKLSEIKGDKAFEVLAEIIEPIAQIASDKEIVKSWNSKPKLLTVKQMLQTHKDELIIILAALNLQSVEEYRETVTLINLPRQVIEMLDDEEVMELFGSQSQTEKTSFGSVTETTEAVGE